MSTFVLKHCPGMRAEEDYSYVSMAQQKRYLLHLEPDRTERSRSDICEMHVINQDPIGKLQEQDPISISKLQDPEPTSIEQRVLDPARPDSPAQQDFEVADDDELPLSTVFTEYSNSDAVEGRSFTVVAAPPLRVALALDMVHASRDVSMGCLVSAMLQGTVQAWTWFHDLLFPRIYFRGRDLRCKPRSQ